MKKYRIAIEETLRKVVEIEAETPGLAVCRAEDEYNEEKHVLSADNFAGADIALSADDTTLMEALGNTDFMEYVQCRFEEYRESISVEDKIRLAFGSFDNALYEFGEYRKEAARNLPQVYLLYRSDAWHSRSSMELIAPFSSLENMMEYLRRKKKEFRLTESDLEEFENNRQTQGRDENYLYESDYLDVLPEQEPELPPKDDAFYDKVFTCGQSELSRRELESLPEPFNTCHVTDEQMEQIVYETEMETRDRLRLGEGESIDFNNDRHSEIWWEEMEKAVVRHGVPYYEAE